MQGSYPVQFDVDFPARPLDRVATAFRIFAAIPILIVLGTLSGETLHANSQTTTYTLASGGGLLFAACPDDPVPSEVSAMVV